MDKYLSIDLDSIDPEEPGQDSEQGAWRGFSRRKRNRHGQDDELGGQQPGGYAAAAPHGAAMP